MRRFTVLLVGAGMAALMLAAAGMAWAQVNDCAPGYPDCIDTFPPGSTPPGTPFVVSTSPADGATGVDVDANIKAKFSEKMLKSSINVDTVRLHADVYDPDTGCTLNCVEPATVSYNAKKKRVTLNPFWRLAKNTTYTAVIEGTGDNNTLAVEDRAGNEMATDYIWHFTTGAN